MQVAIDGSIIEIVFEDLAKDDRESVRSRISSIKLARLRYFSESEVCLLCEIRVEREQKKREEASKSFSTIELQ